MEKSAGSTSSTRHRRRSGDKKRAHKSASLTSGGSDGFGKEEAGELKSSTSEAAHILRAFEREDMPAFLKNARVAGVIGSGSFNMTFLTENHTVLRVSYLPDHYDGAIDMLARGNAVAVSFNGPRLAQAFGVFRTKVHNELAAVTRLPESIVRAAHGLVSSKGMRTGIAKSRHHFWVSEIEYAGQYTLVDAPLKSVYDLVVIAFCLCWTLCVAQAECGFAHRDIKPNNIVVHYRDPADNGKAPITLRCSMPQSDECFEFDNVTLIARLIDFDFAVASTTHDRSVFGNPKYQAPETLMSRFIGSDDDENAYGTDWWAVGFMLFEKLVFLSSSSSSSSSSSAAPDDGGGGRSVDKLLLGGGLVQACAAEAEDVFSVLMALGKINGVDPNDEDAKNARKEQFVTFAHNMFLLCVLNEVVGNEAIPPPECFVHPARRFFYKVLFGGAVRHLLGPVLQDSISEVRVLREAYLKDKSPRADALRALIKHMLSWNADCRTFGLNTYRYLFSEVFDEHRRMGINGVSGPAKGARWDPKPAMPRPVVVEQYTERMRSLRNVPFLESDMTE